MRSRCIFTLTRLALLAAALLVLVRPVGAHHSFAMFDSVNKTTITGTVTRFEWTNPHVFIEIDVPGAGGGVKHWRGGLGRPSIPLRRGREFSDRKGGGEGTGIGNPRRDGRAGGVLYPPTLAGGPKR